MIEGIDLWRAAKIMVKRYGDGAATEAAMRAGEFLDQGILDGERLWIRIMQTIEALQRERPRGGGGGALRRRRALDHQIGSAKTGNCYTDCRIRTRLAFDRNHCYATGDRKWSSGESRFKPIAAAAFSSLDRGSAPGPRGWSTGGAI